MGEADKDWAFRFACPTDAEGMYMIYGRQSCDTRKMEENASIDVGNAKFGGQEALVVLDHVFIPNEYIFLNGEYEFAGMIVERFAGYHRQSYGGCKVGVGDTLIGAAALVAEYNGVEKASAVKDKLIEMTHLNETLYSCGIACSCEGCPPKAGNYQIDLLLANVCKQNVTRFPYEIVRLAEDIAGRLVTIETAVGRVEQQSPQTVSAYRERLEKKMREVLASTTMDEGRILTEAAIFADKVAVDEETVRLRSHVAQLRTMLQAQRPTGKDMDFLMQEFNRECNTIGSKCNDLAVTQDVVAMKAEVEKIREQVQNIE